jgi:hypothetical protein
MYDIVRLFQNFSFEETGFACPAVIDARFVPEVPKLPAVFLLRRLHSGFSRKEPVVGFCCEKSLQV